METYQARRHRWCMETSYFRHVWRAFAAIVGPVYGAIATAIIVRQNVLDGPHIITGLILIGGGSLLTYAALFATEYIIRYIWMSPPEIHKESLASHAVPVKPHTSLHSHISSAQTPASPYSKMNPEERLVKLSEAEIFAYYGGHTTIEGNRLMAPYLGKRWQFTGIPTVVSEAVVAFSCKDFTIVSFYFNDPNERLHLQTLRSGEVVTVEGTLKTTTQHMIDCEDSCLVFA